MINRPPKSFEFNADTENLFLFYQRINEAMFDYAPDSYKAPILNTKLLCDEAYHTYNALVAMNTVDKYYHKYVVTVINELLDALSSDFIAKGLLGGRYEIIVSNLKEAITEKRKFESTIRNLKNYLGQKRYYYDVVQALIELIKGKKRQQELIKLADTWLCEVCDLGYSKQHVYNVTNQFFQEQGISSPDIIESFFEQFDFKRKKWNLLTFADKNLMSYVSGLQKVIKTESISIEGYEVDLLKKLVQQDEYRKLNWFLTTFYALKELNNVECLKCTCDSLDPYTAVDHIQRHIRTLSNFVTNFDNEDKRIYDYCVCLNYSKQRIVVRSAMNRRTRIYSQSYLHNTIKMLRTLRVSNDVFEKILKVLGYHGDAVSQGMDNKYVVSMLWTSLETLFIDGQVSGSKGDVVKDALIEIIQRTYIIKRLKYLHWDFLRNLKATNSDLIVKYALEDVGTFIEMLFDDPTSERTKEVQATLQKNPLLRTRVFIMMEKELKDSDKINTFLINHKKKIEYQIERIYRVRNFLIHAGEEMDYMEATVECLHYYLDFVINYIFAKTEAGDAVIDIYDVIEEARDDNRRHQNILSEHKGETTSVDNHRTLLFGPSVNVLEYYTDHTV